MADEVEVEDRASEEAAAAVKGSDLSADVKDWLSTPQADPAQEAARKSVARGIGQAFREAADLRRQAGETKAEFETRVAESENAGYRKACDDARVEFSKRGLDFDAILDGTAEEPAAEPGKGASPKPGEADDDKPLTRRELKAFMAEQQSQYNERFTAQERREVARQAEEFDKQFYALAKKEKYADALNDPESTDPAERKALDMDRRRCYAEWGTVDASGKSPYDRGVTLAQIVDEHVKSKVAAQKAISSRRKEPAPTASRRGESTREGPGASKPMPEKLAKMGLDDENFAKELKKVAGDVPFDDDED